jgi:CheY-like chemotaxis protein
MQDLLTKELENKTSETKTIFNRLDKEKTIKISSLEVALETRDALLCSLERIYEVIDTSSEEMLLEVFSPIIDSLNDMSNILIGFLREIEKDQHSLKDPANIKTLLDECILEAEEKILHRSLADKKIGLLNRLSASGVVEVNTAAIKSVFDRLIFSIINHSGTDVNILFESRYETGKIVVSLSNYDNGSFMFKTSSRESQRPVAIQLLFRLIQSLFRLNGIEFSVTFTSNTRYRLDTVFKMTEDAAVPFTDKSLPDIFKSEKKQSRILIVDDDDSLRDLMVDILESRNFTVGCYAEAASAIAEFKKNQYDLVITDLSLPGINGIELAAQLKKIKPMMPVVLVSGWGSEIEKIGKQNPEIDFVLPKPFNLVDFLNIVENSLKKPKT